MDYIETQAHATKSAKKTKSKAKPNTKCSWCDRKRARNDLCNVCRQKVESRARRLMEQKLEGDMDVVQKVMKYFSQNVPMNVMTNQQIMSLVLECFPYLMLKFQSENTYRGKKGNRCWCLPESVLKKLITQFYIKDSASTAIVQKGGRQELCDLLMSSVAKSFSNFGVNNIKPNITEDDNDIDINMKQSMEMKMKMEKHPFNVNINNMSNSGSRALKRNTMENDTNNNNNGNPMAPPRKRTRIDNNVNNNNNNNSNTNINQMTMDNEIMPDHQIWGRSDTELLSFDITKLDSFLHKFEREVLDGAEWEKIEPQNRVNFLKGRCKEFTKILTELRDYVMHLRVKVSNNEQNEATLAAKNREIVQLKQRMDEMINSNPECEKLYRCVTNLLQKLAPSPVDSVMLRSNMDKLEQYHDLACQELTESISSFESIGAKLGHQRSSDMTLKQYAAHIHVNIVNNHQNNTPTLGALYVNTRNNSNSCPPSTPSISSLPSNSSQTSSNGSNPSYTTNASSTSSIPHSVINTLQNSSFRNNNLPPLVASTPPNQQNNSMSNVNVNVNQNMAMNNMNNQSRMNHHQSHNTMNMNNNQQFQAQTQQQTQSILLAPVGNLSYNPMSNTASMISPTTNFVTLQQPTTIPINAASLNTLGIHIPHIASITPGQHLPTRFNIN